MKYGLLAVIVFTALFIYGNYWFTVKKITLSSPKIPKEFDGFVILHLSDLHNGSYGKGNTRLIKAVNSLAADVIFYTGDMVDDLNFKQTGFFDLIEGIEQNIPSYYIFGNHEDGLGDPDKAKLISMLEKNNIKILRNEKDVLVKNGHSMYVHGLEIPKPYLRHTYNKEGDLRLKEEDIRTYLGPLNSTDEFHVLLAHNPLYGDSYMKAGYDLTFSGHVHGGMIRLPFIGGIFSPDRKFFPKYSKGTYHLEEKILVVSPVIGGVKGRILNPPCIYKIILKAKLS